MRASTLTKLSVTTWHHHRRLLSNVSAFCCRTRPVRKSETLPDVAHSLRGQQQCHVREHANETATIGRDYCLPGLLPKGAFANMSSNIWPATVRRSASRVAVVARPSHTGTGRCGFSPASAAEK